LIGTHKYKFPTKFLLGIDEFIDIIICVNLASVLVTISDDNDSFGGVIDFENLYNRIEKRGRTSGNESRPFERLSLTYELILVHFGELVIEKIQTNQVTLIRSLEKGVVSTYCVIETRLH
jgi:hypothetical protein